MKFPHSMLLDYVQTDLNAEQVGNLLTMAGFELEGLEEVEGEAVLDIKVMSNRGDGLSVFGLSREVLAKDRNAQATELYWRAVGRFSIPSTAEEVLSLPLESVAIESKNCTRYAARLYKGFTAGATPEWIAKRLRQSGMRPISLLVDLTNYVMLELGQPLHAFDYDKLALNRIVVREATWGEKLTTLNGEEHELLPGMMMICDAEKPVGAPGTMGGLETEVTGETRTMLLESAHFMNTEVRRIRKHLALNTEASYRFERSVDPEGVVGAIRRFTELLKEVISDVEFSNIVDVYPVKPESREILLRLSRSDLLLGMPISAEEAEDYLTRLGYEVRADEEVLEVSVPTWRPDVVREEDVIEDLGRVHGYERIPEELPFGSTTMGGAQEFELWTDQIRAAAVAAGLVQIISHSLRDVHSLDGRELDRIGPRNPASPEMSLLRNSLLPSLADAARRNGSRDVHFFEMGRVFGKLDEDLFEDHRMAFLSTGSLHPVDWQSIATATSDFFSLKGVLDAIFATAGVPLVLRVPTQHDPRLHPNRQAEIMCGSKRLGLMGQLDSTVAEEIGLPSETVVAELSLPPMYSCRGKQLQLRPISRNPSVRRDMAILVDKSVPYAEVKAAIERSAGDLLERQWLFEVYDGQGIPEGKHSLNVALQLRKFGENLTDEEANQVRERVVAALADLGATTR